MKKLIILIIFFPVIMQSCSSATTEEYQRHLNLWINHDVNELLSKWGQPSNVFEKPNGDKMYTFLYVGGNTVTSNYNFIIDQINSNQVKWWCQTTFTANQDDIVIYASCRGNICISEE